VISVRGSQTQDGFRYRVVDEYDNECLLEPNEITVEKPLCLGDFGKFVCRAANIAEIISMNEFGDTREAKAFFRGKSTFYPQFPRYLSRTIEHLLPEADDDAEADEWSEE